MRRLILYGSLLGCWGVAAAAVDGPGDYRGNYDDPEYETRSRPLVERVGEAVDLIDRARAQSLGLPPTEIPTDNPLTKASVQLGRKLFYDRRLSLNGTQSCAMCHIPEQGFTNNELAIAVGTEGRSVGRNTPTLYNVAYQQMFFHDGRESSLENQAWQPILHPNEMAAPSIGLVVERLRTLPDYRGLFEAAYGGEPANMNTVSKALASYQRVLVVGNSPFDQWYYGGHEDAMSPAAQRGFKLFSGKAACITCHTVGSEYAVFSDNKLHNTGNGYRHAMKIEQPQHAKVLIAPGVYFEFGPEVFEELGGERHNDLGRYLVTGNPDDRWKFKTPSLRNVALTAPYMHNGVFATLEEVVEFYDGGGVPNELLSPLIKPLGLSAEEKADLVALLKALTGEYELLVRDAFAAPVGDFEKGGLDTVHFGKEYTPQ